MLCILPDAAGRAQIEREATHQIPSYLNDLCVINTNTNTKGANPMSANVYTKRFNRWWTKVNASHKKYDEISNWLMYAKKTVSTRCDQDQQKLVYTISNRFHRSTYKRLTKANAYKIYAIINKKQLAFRQEKARVHEMLDRLKDVSGAIKTPVARKNVLVKKNIHRKLVSRGNSNNV
jgi:hypothetical protein